MAKSKCSPRRISKGPLAGRYRNPCSGELVKKPRAKK